MRTRTTWIADMDLYNALKDFLNTIDVESELDINYTQEEIIKINKFKEIKDE